MSHRHTDPDQHVLAVANVCVDDREAGAVGKLAELQRRIYQVLVGPYWSGLSIQEVTCLTRVPRQLFLDERGQEIRQVTGIPHAGRPHVRHHWKRGAMDSKCYQ